MHTSTLGLVALLTALAAPLSFAHGAADHSSAHRPYDASRVSDTPFGREGDPRQVSRTVTIGMTDNLRFTPAVITVKRGETVRLEVLNKGRVLHELVLGTPAELKKHAELMRKFPDMEHDEPHMVHVKPGEQGELVWQFTRRGEFEFACLLPGHFEGGMSGKVVVR